MRFCFVSTSRGSRFMTELLAAIADATSARGHQAELVLDAFPPLEPDRIYVVIPHEFAAHGDPQGAPDAGQRERTIALCTENPGTEWFEETWRLVPHFAAAVSINRSSAAELRRRGVRCEHLQLGYVPAWDTWLGDDTVARELDLLYLGAADRRRDPLLGALGKDLWRRRCELLVPPIERRTRPRPDFITGTEKYERLRSARVLLNLHRTTSSALEWMRFLEAICNGCVVVSEPCLDGEPLIAGEHYLVADADDIGRLADRLLDDPGELECLRRGAYEFVQAQLPLVRGVEPLLELAAELPRRPPGPGGSAPPVAAGPASGEPPTPCGGGPPAPSARAQNAAARAAPDRARGGVGSALRPLKGLLGRAAGARAVTFTMAARTPAYDQARPRVTVVSVIDSTAPADLDAFISAAASELPDLELLILAQQPEPAITAFADIDPTLPLTLLEAPRALRAGQLLNEGARRSRGGLVFVLDPHGGIFPSTLARLAEALDTDPAALFAYPMVGVFDAGAPVALASSLPWEPERLGRENWIDSMALIRREALLALGGYTQDPRLAGWEAFELWCRCAETGGHGVHVPQVLAWRSRVPAVDTADPADPRWAVLRELHPRLLARGGGPCTGP